jgi:hypothetical protein
LINDDDKPNNGKFILNLLINNKKIRETILDPHLTKVGIAISPNSAGEDDDTEIRDKVFMLFVKDEDEFVDERKTTQYHVEQDMPLFVLLVIKFLTLVLAMVAAFIAY